MGTLTLDLPIVPRTQTTATKGAVAVLNTKRAARKPPATVTLQRYHIILLG